MTAVLHIEALRDVVARAPDDRLAEFRSAALRQLCERGTPTVRQEDWKYTDLDTVIGISNQWLAAGAVPASVESTNSLVARIKKQFAANWLVIANGQVDDESVAESLQVGIEVTRLSDSDLPLQYAAPLADLNTALLLDGLRISISTDFDSEKPVGLLIVDDASAAIGVAQARIEIDVAAQAEVSFIEYHASAGDFSHYANSSINLRLGNNSNVDFVRLQERHPTHNMTSRLSAQLSSGSSLRHCAFDLGGKLVRNDLQIDLNGHGAHASFTGLYLADAEQHIDNHSRVDHRVGPASSVQEYRGIMAGSSRCIWNGKAIVHDGADGTDAEQANHNLLLSDKAEIDAKPELEIYADDVKCSHGTTIGQLDNTALYYLRTRGLDRLEARRLLTRAFAQGIVGKVPLQFLRDHIEQKVADRLDRLTYGGDE